ncbi:MAG TPA: TlpA family protein disulfide reductase [Chloroflexi bacterium]|nr:TlpA family protein disulfide reductase [Chloroflexota bacterium]HHW87319.1 TlpA family protein disulfide reductase [Chloroflexota bacterium]
MRRVGVLVLILLIAAACGGQNDSKLPAGAQRVGLDEFPTTIGRGFPQAILDEAGPPELLKLGQTPPNFTMLLPDGRHASLADFKGRPVLINFWATWCPPCRAEMPELLQAARDYPDLVLLAVNANESADVVSQFAEQFRMNVPVVIDPEGSISNRYNVSGLPTSIFIHPDGTIIDVRPGAINRSVIDAVLGRSSGAQ